MRYIARQIGHNGDEDTYYLVCPDVQMVYRVNRHWLPIIQRMHIDVRWFDNDINVFEEKGYTITDDLYVVPTSENVGKGNL